MQQLPFPFQSFCNDFCSWTVLSDITWCWLWAGSLDVHSHVMRPLTRDTNRGETGFDWHPLCLCPWRVLYLGSKPEYRTLHRDALLSLDLVPAFVLVSSPLIYLLLFGVWSFLRNLISLQFQRLSLLVRLDNLSSPSRSQLRCTHAPSRVCKLQAKPCSASGHNMFSAGRCIRDLAKKKVHGWRPWKKGDFSPKS